MWQFMLRVCTAGRPTVMVHCT